MYGLTGIGVPSHPLVPGSDLKGAKPGDLHFFSFIQLFDNNFGKRKQNRCSLFPVHIGFFGQRGNQFILRHSNCTMPFLNTMIYVQYTIFP